MELELSDMIYTTHKIRYENSLVFSQYTITDHTAEELKDVQNICTSKFKGDIQHFNDPDILVTIEAQTIPNLLYEGCELQNGEQQ